jgi:hypothetical protein
MRFAILAGAVLLTASACSGNSSDSPSHPSGSLPACPLFDPADASYQGCRAERAYVKCSAANGISAACLSNDPTQCPGAASFFTCADACNTNEFGISCGGIGPQGGPAVPSTCRAMAPTPAGIIFACCPCGP